MSTRENIVTSIKTTLATGSIREAWRCKVWVILGPADMTPALAEKAQYTHADKMRQAVEGDMQSLAYNVYLEDARDNLDPDGSDYYREAGTLPQEAFSIVIEEQKTANAAAS